MGREIVVDASALVELLLQGKPSVSADLREDKISTTTVLDYEFLSAARRAARTSQLSTPLVAAAIADFLELRIDRHEATRLLPRMWSLRDNLSAYDASYVALAESLEVPLLTADRRLARAAEPYCEVLLYS